jgi:hypothetical protein
MKWSLERKTEDLRRSFGTAVNDFGAAVCFLAATVRISLGLIEKHLFPLHDEISWSDVS